ncbi:MAG: 4-hydroxy-tetrahydrodipicolinate synthase [Clostridiales bacterium]|nr:4-hydroxy-tetrahydrodipicolinate synthase [Clostridiales bacterium]
MSLFTGSCTAMITPFTETGVDYDAYGRLIDFQIENGTDAILIAGTTGEPPTMTAEEKAELIRYGIEKVNKRVPVMVSTGGNNTAAVIENSIAAQKMGADLLLIVTPYYNKATAKGLISHYNAVADAVSTPIMVYNVPGRTGLNLTPAVFYEIAKHKNIVAIKEASGNVAQGQEMMRVTKGMADLYSGEDALATALMAMGAKGVVSVVSNILPKDTHAMTAAAAAGNFALAAEMQHKLNPVIDALFCEVNPIPVKTAAGLMGLCSDRMRLPLCPMEDATKARLVSALREYGVSI